MTLEITTIDHVNITVPAAREDATRDYYRTVLGLEEIPKPERLRHRGGAWFRAGPVELHVSVDTEAAGTNADSRRHVCYLVPDLSAAEEALRRRGADIIPDQQPIPGFLRVYLRDPAGNRIDIAQQTG